MKMFVAAQNVAAHCEADRVRRSEQAVTLAELKRIVEEKAKCEGELMRTRSRLEEEEKRNTELSTTLGKLRDERRELNQELATVRKKLDEATQKVDAANAELQTCYDDAIKDVMGSAEYKEKLAAQRVKGYFDLIEKVGEKYPSLDWGFLDQGDEVEETEAEQVASAKTGTANIEGADG